MTTKKTTKPARASKKTASKAPAKGARAPRSAKAADTTQARVSGRLGKQLDAMGYRGVIMIRRKDGKPMSDDDTRRARALVSTFQTWEARIEDALIECARLAPSRR